MSIFASFSEYDHLEKSSKDLQRLFISALDDPSDDSWENLFGYLAVLPSLQLTRLSNLPETNHYLLRIIHQLKTLGKVPSYVPEKLKLLFPKLYCRHDKDQSVTHSSDTVRKEKPYTKHVAYNNTCSPPRPAMHHNDNDLFKHYSNKTVTFAAKKITTNDIVMSTNVVIQDKLHMEQQLHKINVVPPISTGIAYKSNHMIEKPELHPILESELVQQHGCVRDTSPGVVRKVKLGLKQDKIMATRMNMSVTASEPFKLVLNTGIDVVRGFAFGVIPCEIQEVYLNYGDSIRWNPYHLVVIPKINRNSTHFIASKFGFVHVYPNGDCEHQSFASWSRDSAVFHIISEIPVFRDYLPRKMLRTWHNNVRSRKFSLLRKKVYNEGLRCYSPFMITMWKINSLCVDLSRIEIHKIAPYSLYHEDVYLKTVKESEKNLLKYLRKFWEYTDHVMSSIKFDTETSVLELETQKSHMPFVSDIPISIQKQNHLQLEEDLSEAIQRKGQLEKLKMSCRLIVTEHVNDIIENSVNQWMDIILGGPTHDDEEERDIMAASSNRQPCLFELELQLNKKGLIECTLSIDHLRNILCSPLRIVQKCIVLSNETPLPSTGCSSEILSDKHDENRRIIINTGSTSPQSSFVLTTDLLTPTIFNNNPAVYDAESKLNKVLDYVSSEMEEFLEDCNWIEGLSAFLLKWGKQDMGGAIAEAMEPRDIELALMSGYTWLDKLSALPPFFTTSHYVFSISTGSLVVELRPRLQSVMNTVQGNCIYTIHSQCIRLKEMAQRHLEILSCKRYDLEGFAYYAQQLRVMQEDRQRETDNLKRSSSLLESLLATSVFVAREVTELMEETEDLWDVCRIKMREMEEFVDSQTPLKDQGLQENMESCEQEIVQLANSLNIPPFTDPSSDVRYVVQELNKVNASVLGVQSRLVDLGKWRQAITGHSHDMTIVTKAIQYLNGRKTLWNHKLNFNSIETKWLKTPFQQLNIEEMAKKIDDMSQSIISLFALLPVNDPVLEALDCKVKEYHKLIPILKQLSSSSVKTPHWHTLLAAVEEDYQPNYPYTLEDFMMYKLFDPSHTDLIVEVCHTAERELQLKNALHNLQKRWEKLMLTLQQKSLDQFSFAFPKTSSIPANERTTKFLLSPSQHQIQDGYGGKMAHLIAAGNTKEIVMMLEEDLTELQILKGVARAESVKNQIDYWYTMLIQLQEITQLLDTCQDKWWNTLKLFSKLSSDQYLPSGLEELQSCSIKFQEIMNSIHDDPFVLSLLERRRGQKGFRDLQGDSLQQGLENVFNLLERVVSKLKDTINCLSLAFPRLLMLSDWEVLHLNSYHGNPQYILPLIRKMFPSISNINTIEVEKTSSETVIEMGLSRENGYQIVSVEGGCSESLNLCVPLPIGQRKVGEWLSVFEKAIRYSLSCHLTGCSSSLPRKVIGNVAFEEEDSAVLIWLAENVSQAIILAMECHIGHLIKTCLDIDEHIYRDSIGVIQQSVERATSYCIQLIRSIRVSSPLTEPQTNAVTNTLRNIILLLKHKQDVFSCLIAKSSPPDITTLMSILYHLVDCGSNNNNTNTNTTSTRNNSRLGSLVPSLVVSRSSITHALPAISRLQNAHEALVNSSKSLLSSKQNGGSQSMPGNGTDSPTIRRLVTTVPSIPTQCYVQCGSQLISYGFEYHGNVNIKIPLTPNTEKCLYQMMRGLSCHGGGYTVSDTTCANEELGKELSMVLGRSYYSLSCITATTSSAIHSILLASLQIGCIVLLTGIESLNTQARIKFNGWLGDIKLALDRSGLMNISTDHIEPTSKYNNSTTLPKTSITSSTHSSSTISLFNRNDEGTSNSNTPGLVKSSEDRIDWYNGDYGEELLGKNATIDLWGNQVIVRSQYGCIVTVERDISELKVLYRITEQLAKDKDIVIECLLLAHGFCKATELSSMLLGCLKDLQGLKLLKSKLLTSSILVVKLGHNYLTEAMSNKTVPTTVDSESIYLVKGLLHLLDINRIHDTCTHKEIVLKTVSKWFHLVDTDINMEPKMGRNLLVNIVNKQLEDSHLNKNQTITDKIVQLHYGLLNKKCGIITGVCGSGKSTIYQTLVKAYNSLVDNPLIGGHVYVHVINPAAYSSDEFFGGYQSTGSQWQPGLFPKLLQNLSDLHYKKTYLSEKDPTVTNNTIEHWIILDGTVSQTLIEWITILLTETIILPNGDSLTLPDHCRLIIETSHLDLTPSIIPYCVYIHCNSLFTYKDVITTWLKRASTLHDISTAGIEVLSSLMDIALPELIQFVTTTGNDLLNYIKASSINIDVFLTNKFLSLLSSVLERNSPKQNDTSSTRYTGTTSSRVSSSVTSRMSRVDSIPNIPSSIDNTSSIHVFPVDRDAPHRSSFMAGQSMDDQSDVIIVNDEVLSECSDIDTHIFHNQQYHSSAMFLFTAVWSFGAYMPYSSVTVFSNFIRELASDLPTCQKMFPPGGLVFDYYLDLKTYCFIPWNEKKQEKRNSQTDKHYITVPELERYAYICDLHLSYSNSIILIGDQGSGKTSFVKNMMTRTTSTTYPITHMTTSSSLQSSIITRLSLIKKRQGTSGISKKSISQRNTFLIDDLHLAKNSFDVSNNSNKECFDESPIIEMFSMIAEHKIIPDRTRNYTHSLKGIRILATSTSTGTRKLSLKLLSHFNAVSFFPLSNHSLEYIVNKKLSPWIQRFSFDTEEKNEACLAVACVTVFHNMKSRFNPSATNPHLLYTLHDITAVWDGLLLLSTTQVKPAGSLFNRRGLIGFKESNSKERRVTAGRTNTSKTKSGKPSITSGRKGNQTGRGIRKLPSLTESDGLKSVESKHNRLQRTLTSGLIGMIPRDKSQHSFLSTSLPVTVRERTGNEGKGKGVALLRGVLRLWCHEVSRVYGDRLTDSKEKIWMMKLLDACCRYCFCGTEIEESDSSNTSNGLVVVNRNIGKRARPGRPRGGGLVSDGIVPVMKLQATTLEANNILYMIMVELLPKEKQIGSIDYDDFAVKGEDLTSLMFAKLPLPNESSLEQQQINGSDKKFTDYTEIGDGQVKDAINNILEKQSKEPIDRMVLSKQGMEHVIRLCRALVIPRTHCLLLGQRAVGKKMATRLAAKMFDAVVYELNHTTDIRQCNGILRDACVTAGLDKQKVVLLVDADNESQNDCYWKNVLELMREGLVTDLFTMSEILIMSNKVNTEKLRRTTDSAYQGFADVIKSNLHVVITWNTISNGIFTINTYYNAQQCDPRFTLEENWCNLFHSVLCNCSYIDVYQIWTKESYSEIALQFWSKNRLLKKSSMNSSDLEALSYLAAHIHLTGVSVLYETLPDNVNRWVGTPGDYVQCLQNAFDFYENLKKHGEDKVHRLHSSLSHLYDLEREVNNLEYKLESDLQPRLETAENNVTHHKELIITAKERYMESHEKCKKAEETIDTETENVKKYKKLVDEKFQEVSLTYNSAIRTLSSIERSVVMEVMGYRAPTMHLLPVFEGLCLLFDRPPTWEYCHQLMLSHHFYESLKFFDRDNVSQKKLNKLEELLANQKKIYLPRMAEISQAVVPIVLWIAALVDYRKAKTAVQPFRDQLKQAEDTLSLAQEVYVTMRHDMLATKANLEVQHVQHKEAVKTFKAIKEDVQEVQAKTASIQRILNSLSNQKKIWEGRLTDTQTHLDCLPAESLLISALATYCSPLDSNLHKQLWECWIHYCQGKVSIGRMALDNTSAHKMNIRIEFDLNVQNILVESSQEILAIERREIFSDTASLEKALLWKLQINQRSLFIQVLFDPDFIAYHYIQKLYINDDDETTTTKRLVTIESDSHNLANELIQCLQHDTLTILRVSLPINTDHLCSIIRPILSWSQQTNPTDKFISLNGETIVPHHDFQLYIILPFKTNYRHSFTSYVFRSFAIEQLSNLELSEQGLSTVFNGHIVEQARRELSIQRRALLADLILHNQSVLKSEEAIMSFIAQFNWSGRHYSESSEIIIKSIQDKEQNRTDSLHQVMDTKQGLNDITKHVKPYKRLADHIAVIYLSCRKLSNVCPQVSITLDDMKQLLTDILTQQDNSRIYSSRSSLPTFLRHLAQASTLKLYKNISPSLFSYQQLLFPLLVSLSSTIEELHLLQKPIHLPILESLQNTTLTSNQLLLHCSALSFVKSDTFSKIVQSMQECDQQWKEYFDAPPTLLLPLPINEDQPSSLIQKLTIWKIFQPGKFTEAVKNYITLTLGPEFTTPVSHDLSHDISVSLTLCVYKNQYGAGITATQTLLNLLKTEEPPAVLSILNIDFIEQLSRLLSEQSNIVIIIDNILSSCLNQIIQIFKILDSFQSNNVHLYMPIPDTFLSILSDHIKTQLSYRVIALPHDELANTSKLIQADLYQLYGYDLNEYNRENFDYIAKLVDKLYQTSSTSNNAIVVCDLVMVKNYLSGREGYSVHIGYLLSCMVHNIIPKEWMGAITTQECTSLIDYYRFYLR